MRAGLTVLIVFVGVCAERSRARADEDPASPILIHPGVVTVLEFPDAIVHTWLDHHGEVQVARIRDKLYIRPRSGTPVGVEAWLEVETRTLHRTFRLLVVARASDARKDVWIVPVKVQAAGDSPPEVPAELPAPLALPAGPVGPPPALTPAAAEPAASALSAVPNPAPPAGHEPTGEAAGSTIAPILTGIWSSRPEISVHAIASLGFTRLDIAGYAPLVARQRHLGFSARLRVARPNAWWAMEASVSGEQPGGRMSYVEHGGEERELSVEGGWLRAEVGMRMWLGGNVWAPSAYAGLGMQAHLRRTDKMNEQPETVETMSRGAVLVLGIGLERRVGGILVGLDFQVREGGPDGYGSMAALWTIGCVLERGE